MTTSSLPVWIVAAIVLLWRAVAGVRPFRSNEWIAMTSDSDSVRLALGVMGLVFIAAALVVARRSRERSAGLFALYLLTGGLHWGGPFALDHPAVEISLVALYFVASSLGGAILLLQACLRFTSPTAGGSGPGWFTAYSVVALLSVASLVPAVLPGEQELQAGIVSLLPILGALAMLISVAAVAVLVHRLVRPRRGAASRSRVSMLLAALGLTSVPSLLGAADVYNLGFVVVPLVTSYVLTRPELHATPRRWTVS